MTWDPDVVEDAPAKRTTRHETVHLEDLDDGRCKVTSWGPARTKLPTRPTYENHFGPGGFNRCIGDEGHANPLHKDEWGTVFTFDANGRFKTVRQEKA